MMNMLKLSLMTLALLIGSSVIAQEHKAPNAKAERTKAEAPADAQAPSTIAEDPLPGHDLAIDFTYEGLMFCDVQVGDSDRVWKFLIDSGAGSCVLNERTANELGIEGMEVPGGAKGVGTQDAKMAQNVSITVGGHKWTGAAVIILDLSSIADQTGEWMDGIIGADWLMQFDLCKFDFRENKAYFKIGAGGRKSFAAMLQGMLGGGGGGGGAPGGDGMADLLKKLFGGGGGGVPLPDEGDDEPDDKGDDASPPDSMDDIFRKLRRNGRVPGSRNRNNQPETPKRTPAEDRDGEYGPSESFSQEVAPFVGLSTRGKFFPRPRPQTIQSADPIPAPAQPATQGIPRAALKASKRSVTLDLRMLETGGDGMLGQMFEMLGGAPVLDPHWFVDIEIDGEKTEIIFDTGAMGLFALDLAYADGRDLGRSFSIPVTGVGENTAYMGLVKSFAVSSHREEGEFGAACLDLSALDFEKMAEAQPMLKMLMPKKLPKPAGLLGIEFARRYRFMTVDHSLMQITFDPYSAEDLASIDIDAPDEEAMVVDAIKQTWAGNGAALGFDGESLPIEDWEEYGVEGGLRVTGVESGSGADQAGLKAGDVILTVIGEGPVGDDGEAGEEVEQPIRGMATAAFLAAMAGSGETFAANVRRTDGRVERMEWVLSAYTGKMVIPERYRAEVEELKAASKSND